MVRTVIQYTDSTGWGGAEQAMLHLLGGLDRARWQPLLVHHGAPGLAPLIDGARQLGVEQWMVPPMRGGQGLAHMAGFARRLRAAQPAVFHAHLTWPLGCKQALVAAIGAQVPAIIATEHLFVPVPWRRSRLVERVVALGVHRYIAVSHDLAQQLQTTFEFPPRKLAVVHNGIMLDHFDQPRDDGLRASLLAGRERPIVLAAARLDPQKGQQYLLEAATHVPDALFVLAGDGPDRRVLEAQARALGVADRVVFLGQRHDIPALLASCDLFVLPSLFEGLPLGVLEAMAAGVPIVASDVGGVGEAVTNNTSGLLVPPCDPAALADAVTTLLHDQALAQRLAIAARMRVRTEFEVDTMVRRVTGIYDEVLGAQNAKRKAQSVQL